MRVLDLFAGMKGWSAPFEARGHDVVSVELSRAFPDITIYADVMDTDLPERIRDAFGADIDLILASPPCTSFTTMTMGKNWTYEGQPRTETARIGAMLVNRTLELIDELTPDYYIIENPRARLRTLSFLEGQTHLLAPGDDDKKASAWYCHYGEDRAKPTDLWGDAPPSLVMRPGCHNRRKGHAADCCCMDHLAAPRGSYTGTQGGVSAAEAGRIPFELALDVCLAAERAYEEREAA